jgi:ABC-type transporter Mla subunit MlaD
MQIHKNEITTGILVLATLGILIAVLAVIGMPGLVKPINTYRVYYDNANGIRPGAPVLLAGREIGKVTALKSPVPLENRPTGHPDDEVAIDVQVDRSAQVYRSITVRLTQQGLMGQQVIDFVHGDVTSGLADNHAEFVGERVPDLTESVDENLKRLTGPGSDLSETLKNARTFMEKLNNSQVINNAEQFTDTVKREPWRLIWPSTKEYPGDQKAKEPPKEKEPKKK